MTLLSRILSLFKKKEKYLDITGTAFVEKLKALQWDGYMPKRDLSSFLSMNILINKTFAYTGESGGDHWLNPDQFFYDRGGDCEDFAIVKYHYLKKKHKCQIAVCQRKSDNVAHAVLLVDDKWVLDNLTSEIRSYTDFLKLYTVRYRADSNGILEGSGR